MESYNVIVAGGGFAGVAAAISAGRAGLRVLLLERGAALGGAAAHNLVNPFMPNATNVERNGVKERFELSQGLFTEIKERLRAENAIDGNEKVFHEEYCKLILNRMVLEAGVQLLFHAPVIGASAEKGVVSSVTVAGKSGPLTFSSDYFVDATGDAELARFCGFSTRLGRENDGLCQPMTLCFRVGNVDIPKFEAARHTINPLYKKLQAEGKIKNIREDVLVFRNLCKGVLHFNSTRVVRRNPVDSFDLTLAEIEAREQAFELFRFLQTHIDGFQDADLLFTAAEIGVRESRMIDGEYLLTGADLVACTRFDDSIALGNYDIDIHNPEGSGTSHYYFPDGQYYTIPYRALIPKGSANLLTAGRCVSADHEAQASVRIMPIVCCMGEAAGTALGIAAKACCAVKDVDIRTLQTALTAQKAVW